MNEIVVPDRNALGVIVVSNAEHKLAERHVRNRVQAIAEELGRAGVGEVVVLPLLGSRRHFLKLLTVRPVPGLRKVGASQLAALMAGRSCVVVEQEHYHVAHEWVADLLARAGAEGRVLLPEGQRTNPPNQLNHQRIQAVFCAVPPSLAADFGRLVAQRAIWVQAPKPSLRASGLPFEELPVTARTMAPMYRRAATLDRPVNFHIELNSDCNYRCLMCPYHGGRQSDEPTFIEPGTAKRMPIETFKGIIDQIASLDRPYEEPGQTIRITPYQRGELLLHPDWREAVRYVKEKGFECYFSTNGGLWKEDDLDFVIGAGVDLIQFSLNGYSKETHRKLRLNDEYDHVAKMAIELVHRRQQRGLAKPLVQACNIFNERTIDQIKPYVDYWLPRVDMIEMSPENFMEAGNANVNYKMEFGVGLPDNAERPPCSMIKDYVFIDSEGKSSLCLGAKLVSPGNVNELGIAGLLEAPKRAEVIAMHGDGNYDNEVCRNCQQWYSLYYWRTEETEEYYKQEGPATQTYCRKLPPDPRP